MRQVTECEEILEGLVTIFPIIFLIGVITTMIKKIDKYSRLKILAKKQFIRDNNKIIKYNLTQSKKKLKDWSFLLKDWKVWAILIFLIIMIVSSVLFSSNNDVVKTQNNIAQDTTISFFNDTLIVGCIVLVFGFITITGRSIWKVFKY